MLKYSPIDLQLQMNMEENMEAGIEEDNNLAKTHLNKTVCGKLTYKQFWCMECNDSGNGVICDTCNHMLCFECLGLPDEHPVLEESTFICISCHTNGPYYVSQASILISFLTS
jgi:hypothetical protein